MLNLYKHHDTPDSLYGAGRPACDVKHETHSGITRTQWFLNGEHHRVNGPALSFVDGDGVNDYWLAKGQLHRIGGPAAVHNDSSRYTEKWFRDGALYREKGPECINITNTRWTEEWGTKEGRGVQVEWRWDGKRGWVLWVWPKLDDARPEMMKRHRLTIASPLVLRNKKDPA
jgi:hypothetical protein